MKEQKQPPKNCKFTSPWNSCLNVFFSPFVPLIVFVNAEQTIDSYAEDCCSQLMH